MQIALVGPGRAGQAVAIAARGGGHEIVAVAARDPEQASTVAHRFDGVALVIGEPLPPVDLIIIAVRDDAITEVADTIAPVARNAAAAAVHLSGATSVAAISALADNGIATGAFHPLQTFPNAGTGARALPGSWVAVTADEPFRSSLHEFARTMGCIPFDLADNDRAVYHAAAAAAANFPIAALAVAERLLNSAGVPFGVVRPLTEEVVTNAFEQGPSRSLTGPIARKDTATVEAQMAAAKSAAPELAEAFEAMARATAVVAGTLPTGEPA